MTATDVKHKVVSSEEWLKARKEFLAEEREFTHKRDELSPEARQVYDTLAHPQGGTLRGLRGPGGITLHSNGVWRHSRPLNRYLRYEAGLGGRVRELAILTTARELDS